MSDGVIAVIVTIFYVSVVLTGEILYELKSIRKTLEKTKERKRNDI